MVEIRTVFLGVLALLISSVSACQRGLGWATNNDYAPNIGNTPLISWYHHWEFGPVPQMPSKVEFVPMFWGPSKWDQWSARVDEMNKATPNYLMAFNEPDVESQANMDPYYAAQLYMEQINPWASKGTKLGSPAIAWSLDWMNTFLSEISNKGGQVDFICVHWYGSWADIETFKTYVQTVHSQFGKNVWVTELGVTTGSNPTQDQVKSFMMNAFSWMDTQSYIERGSWFGAFESNSPPDGFASGMNALFQPGGQLSDMGMWYAYTSQPNRRSLRSRHHVLSRRDSNKGNTTTDPIHCDSTCELRNAQVASYASTLAARRLHYDS